MTAFVNDLDNIAQEAYGFGSEFIGTQFDVYRLATGSDGRPVSQGSILNGDPIFPNVYFEFARTNEAKNMEQINIYDMIFTGFGDASKLEIGDVLVEKDPAKPIGGMFTFVDKRPLKPNIFVRTEIAGSLSRSFGVSGSTNLQGKVGTQSAGKQTEQPIILKDGFYYILQPNDPWQAPAAIPVGLQPYKRLGPTPPLKLPTTTHRTEMFAYIPNLRGLYLQPGEIISDQNGNRFQIHTISVFNVGIQGYQVICESVFV